MGLYVHSIGELPTEAYRSYYVYLLDYGWDEAFGTAVRRNLARMADAASRSDAVVIHGPRGMHFEDEVLSWHEKKIIAGDPDQKHISTSYIERQNLTMRRFTRLTNAFSKKLENHIAAIAIHCMYYNFVRIHQTLRVTPAMAAGVTDRLWSIEDLVGLIA